MKIVVNAGVVAVAMIAGLVVIVRPANVPVDPVVLVARVKARASALVGLVRKVIVRVDLVRIVAVINVVVGVQAFAVADPVNNGANVLNGVNRCLCQKWK